MEIAQQNEINVLVVDDAGEFTETVTTVLEDMPYAVKTVNTSEEALDHMHTNRVDIIVLDVRMPGMSGFDLIEKVRAINPDTYVIAISPHGKLDMAVEFMKQGAVEFLQKPLDNADIKVALESAVEKWSLRQELFIANRHLKRMNDTLEHEIHERERAEELMMKANKELQIALVDLNRMQEQLIKKERMGALGQMARGVAHDFNNALQPIMLAAGFIQTNPEKLIELGILNDYIDEIVQATEAAAKTVRRLVRFYSPTSGEDSVALNLRDLLSDVVDITQPRWKNEAMGMGKTIDMQVDIDECFVIDAYHDELQEAFVNLIFNAVEAIDSKGAIRLSAEKKGELHIVICVEDDGHGMSEEVLARCMEPFMSTRMQKGAGLGLSVTYGIIQHHKGSMDIESIEGKGTTIRIELPASKTAAVPTRKKEEPDSEVVSEQKPERKDLPQDVSGKVSYKVLVVDDEVPMRRMMTRILQRMGHEVDAEETGLAGWNTFQEKRHDLVITDQAMPEMTGEELARKVKGVSSTTPVIMVTGFGDLLEARKRAPEVIDMLMSKPVQIAQITDAIGLVMKKE